MAADWAAKTRLVGRLVGEAWPSMAMLEARDLTKSYGAKRAVDALSFTVESGGAFGLLGPNGAGKSTVISMLATLLTPDQGRVFVDGLDAARKKREVRRMIGLVPQDVTLFMEATAEENLRFFGTLYGLRGAQLKGRIAETLEMLGLSAERKTVLEKFSGGMKRRINIGVALLHEPALIIMDEPTVGIDPQSRAHILDMVKKLCRQGKTVVYTSHYMEEVELLCDRLAIMDHGKMIAYGSLQDVRKLAGSFATIDIDVTGLSDEVLTALQRESAIGQAVRDGERLRVLANESGAATAQTVAVLARHGLAPRSVAVQVPNLETVFLHLTGRTLRDDAGAGA
ncbi:MAG: ABC transporter ATP-binding protein [Bacilli bacterium]